MSVVCCKTVHRYSYCYPSEEDEFTYINSTLYSDLIVSPLLRDLHWLRVPLRTDFKLVVLTYRCYHSTAPPYLADELCRVADGDSRRRLRSASTSTLIVSPSGTVVATSFLYLTVHRRIAGDVHIYLKFALRPFRKRRFHSSHK